MARTRNQPPPTRGATVEEESDPHSLLILPQSQISSPNGSGPRYAPVDPTLPEPWKGLVDLSTGYLYYWNPVTNKTQYEKPVKKKLQGPPPPPAKPASLSVSSSVLRGEAHDEDGRSRSHQAHPGAIQYRHKAVPSFENLQIIYGKDRATGLGAETVKERHVRLEMEKEVSDSINTDQEGDEEIDQEDDIESVASSNHQEQAPKASSSKVTYKRKYGASNHNISEEFHMLKTGMDSVASAIFSCAPRVYTEEEIFEEVSKVEGLDEDSQLLAYDYLCEDAVRGRTFIGLPIKRRKRWLELKLGRG